MSRKTKSQILEIWKQEDERRERVKRQVIHELAVRRLLEGLGHIRTSGTLGLREESSFQHSNMLKNNVLCGVSYKFITYAGKKIEVEICHYNLDQFWIIFESAQFINERIFLCRVKFKNIPKILEFLIPLFKEL